MREEQDIPKLFREFAAESETLAAFGRSWSEEIIHFNQQLERRLAEAGDKLEPFF